VIVAPNARQIGEPAGFPFSFPGHSIEEVSMKEFLLDDHADMVERGLIMAAIVVAAIFLWVSIGQKLAVKLGIVDSVVGG
jgi:hypothetical protein